MKEYNRKFSRGSVMLEFVFVLPIYMLLFGATFLMFELSIARLNLLESNRNLAWLAEDRYDTGEIGARLLAEAKRYYEERNGLERQISFLSDKLYSFGAKDDDLSAWAHRLEAFEEGSDDAKVSIKIYDTDGGWLSGIFGNRWCSLYSGNMALDMNRVSAAYIGVIALSDIFHPNEYMTEFYKAKYHLTRARDGNGKPLPQNGESLVIHRKDNSNRREKYNTASLDLALMTLEGWPIGEGMIGSAIGDLIQDFTKKHSDQIDQITSWMGF